MSRAQTTLDFAIGMSVFLGVVAFAFGFIPTMFAPFETETGTNAVIADRVGDRLVGDALAEEPTNPSILNGTCTASFFAGDSPGDCRYTTADLHRATGVQSTVNLNVTVYDDSDIQTLDGVELTRGPSPSSNDVVVARRIVSLPTHLGGGATREAYRLEVKVW
ncbi:DUF7287 family protein [Haloplanus halobius]|uniref:DUF7287 family protein n=1 Tax=Haloplanus halobius TaxID=2934938 RepID=UPI00200E2B17|nr:hypothetical protein [Haloplanus sp. XH21]